MSWRAPRTGWRSSDPYLADDDARLRGNANVLRSWANRVCAPVDNTPLGNYSENDVLTVSAYNLVEQALATVAELVGPADYTPRKLAAGDPVWDAKDLNRLESVSATLYKRLEAADKNRRTLAFMMGGDGFNAALQ